MAGRPSRNTLILLVVGCIAVFTVGIILLVVGFVKYTRPYPSVPYMWSLNLCQVNNTEKWVGLPLGEGEGCPPDPLGSASPQSFAIPRAPILFPDVPYNPVLYVTNKVTGIISFSHKVHGEVVFSTSVMLSSLEVTKFAVCGGAELVVFRNGPVAGSEGDYISSDFCHNNMTGCQYEPGRSLNSYKFEGVRVDLDTIPEEGSELVVDSIILEADYTHIIMPDALIHYEVGGRGEEQSVGLVLLALGAIMADLMPAAVYFLLSKPAVPS